MKKFFAISAAAILALTGVSSAYAQSAAGSNSNSNSGSYSNTQVQVNSNAASKVRTVGNAIAPGLISGGIETCQGSVSAAAGGMGWGVSLGSTRMDVECNRRLNAKMVGLLGDGSAAKEVMCGSSEVRAAFARVGRPCIEDRIAARNAAARAANTRSRNVANNTRRPKVQTASAAPAPCSLFGSNRCR